MSRVPTLSSPFLLGFDDIERALDRVAKATSDGYPPYNIERIARDGAVPERLRITLAVAGFKSGEIEITAQQNLLLVAGKRDNGDQDRSQFLHVGIANRSFERRFELADFVRVEDANLADGLLTIDLVREIPEAMKPQKIAIGGGAALESGSVESIVDKRKAA